MVRVTIFVVLSLLATVLAEVSVISKCDNSVDDICTVSEVRITPCRKGNRCKLKKGKLHTISIDFEPKFSTSKLKTGVFWASGARDIPFSLLDNADACQYTTCPTEAGKSQQLNYSLQLWKKMSRGKFTLKWKIWNEENNAQLCCFLTDIEIVN